MKAPHHTFRLIIPSSVITPQFLIIANPLAPPNDFSNTIISNRLLYGLGPRVQLLAQYNNSQIVPIRAMTQRRPGPNILRSMPIGTKRHLFFTTYLPAFLWLSTISRSAIVTDV